MSHVYMGLFIFLFFVGGIGLPPAKPKPFHDRLPETVYVAAPEKYQDRLEKICQKM